MISRENMPHPNLTLWAIVSMLVVVILAGCTSTRPPLPGPVVEVSVPIPVPCEVEQVEITPLPSEQGVSEDIYDAVKVILADRAILKADREQLKAANSDPCPEIEQ